MSQSSGFRLVSLCKLVLIFSMTSPAWSQVVINELVQDERSAGSGQIPDTREFIELYNAGGSAANIAEWYIDILSLDDGNLLLTIPIPGGAMIPAGDYFVIGNSTGVPNVDFDLLPFGSDLLATPAGSENLVYELRDNSANLVDALAVDVRQDPQTDFITPTQQTQTGNGWWGQFISSNTSTPQSLGRYLDGRDTNNNGRDFGLLPLTPGASNNLPQATDYVVPDITNIAIGGDVPGFSSSFVQPKVVDPTQTGPYVLHPTSPSPQGGKAIVAWDPSGGGNMVATNALVNGFDVLAYLDTEPFNVSTGEVLEWETTIYGIGTTDPFFSNPDPTALFTTATTTNNGSTGIGWLYQKEEVNDFESLMLVDFGPGGNSLPGTDWTILQTIDLSTSPSGWHRLSLDFDPSTGDVVARYDDQVFNFTTSTDLVGTFYVGYREALSNGVPASAGPPIFQQYIESTADDADFNGDGSVDGKDFLIWQRGFGTADAMLADGDANGDGTVDADDLQIWQGQYASLTAAAISVPEPASVGLLLVCVGLAVVRNSRK